jgi:hypothetical protein
VAEQLGTSPPPIGAAFVERRDLAGADGSH